ncbi:MAG: beta-lactamase family protein [Flavobacteriales bacterium]|nr:beta-lactamase family protein [Flavobacteriales bacterium]
MSSLILACMLLAGCVPLRAVFLGRPDGKDIHRFPSSRIAAGNDCFQFHHDLSGTGNRIRVNEWGSGTPYFVTLQGLMDAHRVRSLLVIRNDTILFEAYGQGKSATDVHASFSVAKSFVSALVGIAISEGKLRGEQDLVTDHLPELKGVPYAEQLRVSHLLNMTSGIRHRLRTDATLYYGNDVTKALHNLEFAHRPGTYQEYLNINVQLLGLILERVTGMSPAAYLSQRIWQPLGMCSDALWSTDRKGHDLTFCCMGATALDYAKFGRLYLNMGEWNGVHVLPEDWVRRSVARDTTEGSSFNYNYLWHLGDAGHGDYMADGLFKQHIYVDPSKRIIIVSLCDRENPLRAERTMWRNVFRQIVDQL